MGGLIVYKLLQNVPKGTILFGFQDRDGYQANKSECSSVTAGRYHHPQYIYGMTSNDFTANSLIFFEGDNCHLYHAIPKAEAQLGGQREICKCPFINLLIVHKSNCSLSESHRMWK